MKDRLTIKDGFYATRGEVTWFNGNNDSHFIISTSNLDKQLNKLAEFEDFMEQNGFEKFGRVGKNLLRRVERKKLNNF